MPRPLFALTDTKFDKKIVLLTERLSFKLALCLIASMTILSGVVISPAIVGIAKHFAHTPHIEFLSALVVSLPALFVVIFSPIAGFCLDRFRKLPLLYPAIVLWSLSGMAGAFCENIITLLLTRCVFGIATAFVMSAVGALTGDYYNQGGILRKERFLSLQNALMAFIGAVATFVAGYLSGFAWNLAFFVYGFGIIVFIVSLPLLFEPRIPKHIANPSEPLNFKTLIPIYLIAFILNVIFYICPTQLPYFMQNTLGVDSKLVGIAMSLPTLSFALTAWWYKSLCKFLGIFAIYAVAFGIFGVGLLGFFVFESYGAFLICLSLIGAGAGLIYINNPAYLLSLCPPNAWGKAFGYLASAVFLGQFLSPLFSAPLIQSTSIIHTFLLCAIVCLVLGGVFGVLCNTNKLCARIQRFKNPESQTTAKENHVKDRF